MTIIHCLTRCLLLSLLLATCFMSAAIAQDYDVPNLSSSKNYHTKHFRVIYYSEDTTLTYAKTVGAAAEDARKTIIEDMGYQEAMFLSENKLFKNKLDIYIAQITSNGKNTKDTGAYFHHVPIRGVIIDPYLVVNLKSQYFDNEFSEAKNWATLKSVMAHEYFHAIQAGYDHAERDWLDEATAEWIMDKVFPVREELWLAAGWRSRFDLWMRGARNSASVFSRASHTDYAASVFFQYLSERSPGMDGVVLRIWQQARRKQGSNTFEAIGQALGDPGAWGPRFRKRIGDFAAAIFIGGPKLNPTYSLAKLKNHTDEYLKNNHPLKLGSPSSTLYLSGNDALWMKGIAVSKLDKNKISPRAFAIQPYQIKYLQIQPANKALLPKSKDAPENGKLVVAVRGTTHPDWEFRLIEAPILDDTPVVKKWTMRPFPKITRAGQWSFLEVEKFPYSRPVIVAVNTKPIDFEEDFGSLIYDDDIKVLPRDKFEVAAAFLSPPLVTSVTVAMEEDSEYRPVWKFVRQPASRPGTWRARLLLDEGIRYDKDKAQKLKITVTTNHGVKDKPKMTIGDVDFELSISKKAKSTAYGQTGNKNQAYGIEFEAIIEVSAFAKAIEKLKQNKTRMLMPLSLKGKDSWGVRFDEKYWTQPKLNSGPNDTLTIDDWEGEGPKDQWKEVGPKGLGGADKINDSKLPIYKIDPPAHLGRLEARQKGKIVYRAFWQSDPERLGDRQLKIADNKSYDPDSPLDVTLTFSEPVKAVKLSLGRKRSGALKADYSVTLPDPKEETKTQYSTTIPANEKIKKKLVQNSELTFFVNAQTESGVNLDADPRTPAKYDWDEKRFSGLEKDTRDGGDTSKGGIDEWHSLNIAGRSLVILLDASGSMAWHGRLEMFKKDIRDVITNLRANDEVALIVFFNCKTIRVMAPFSHDPKLILRILPGIKPAQGTPLGDAIEFANNYLERNGRYLDKKLLPFTDGEPTCGKSPVKVVKDIVKPEKQPVPQEEEVKEIKWSVFRAGGKLGGFIPDYWVEEVTYHEKQGNRAEASLTVRRYSVSWISDGVRTVWSINWSRSKVVDKDSANGAAVDALRAKAEAMRANGVTKEKVQAAVQTLIGLGAQPLNRS